MMLRAAILFLIALPAGAASVLTFEDVLARMNKAHGVSQEALDAARQLEMPRPSLPNIRFETSASSAENVDLFAQNILRFNAVTMILSVDYPLLDGGVREAQARAAKVGAAAFRQRVRANDEEHYRETLEAVARLYLAQERLRILDAALQRATGMRDRARQLSQVREISNNTAALWEEQALGAESQRLDLELQRLDAETHVKQLIGDASPEPIMIALDLDEPVTPSPRPSSPAVESAVLHGQQMRAAVADVEAARRPQVMLSAFGGIAALGAAYAGDRRQRYGIYGLRMTLALPMFDAASARRVAEAKLEAEEAAIEQRTAIERDDRDTSSAVLATMMLRKRIALLRQAAGVARKREESVVRLMEVGIRSESDAADAAVEQMKRESDVLGARVDLWKLARITGR